MIKEYGIYCMIALIISISALALINLGKPSITGFVTAENETNLTTSNAAENITTNITTESTTITESAPAANNSTDAAVNESSIQVNETALANETNTTPQTATNESVPESSPQAAEPAARNIDISLEFKTNTVYDEDNNGEGAEAERARPVLLVSRELVEPRVEEILRDVRIEIEIFPTVVGEAIE